MVKNLFFGREKEIGIVVIISIIISSNILLFSLQNAIEVDLRRTTSERQRDLQLQSTKEVAQHMELEKNQKFLYLTHPGVLKNVF